MNREFAYVWKGFFLLLVILSGASIVSRLSVIESLETSESMTYCGVKDPVDSAAMIYPRGAQLFRDNCSTCHKVDKHLTGPALRGVEERVKNKKLLYSWIRNNAAVLKSGNKYFNDLYKEWGQVPMAIFPNLTDEEIADILSYIRENKTNPAVPAGIVIACE